MRLALERPCDYCRTATRDGHKVSCPIRTETVGISEAEVRKAFHNSDEAMRAWRNYAEALQDFLRFRPTDPEDIIVRRLKRAAEDLGIDIDTTMAVPVTP